MQPIKDIMHGITATADERENRRRLWFSSPLEIGGNFRIKKRKKDWGRDRKMAHIAYFKSERKL